MAGLHLTLIIPAFITFIATVVAVKFVQSYMLEAGVTSPDHNKKKHVILPSSGGIAVAFGVVFGILAYIFGGSFNIYYPIANIDYLFATMLSIILITFVGFLDDINVSKKLVKTTGMQDYRKGLKQWQKPLFTLIGAVPLMALNAGISTIDMPIIGMVNFGIIYPLILIPIAVMVAANVFNLLGGFDGIASGSATVAVLGMLIYSSLYGNYNGALLSAVLFAAVLAFLFFDHYPAKILTGDSFTYCVGAGIVAIAIIGSMEAFAIVIFFPWFIESLLHLKSRFKTTDLGKLQPNGTFKPPYGKKIYSWTHLIMNLKPMKEWQVSLTMWSIEACFVLLAFGLKLAGLL
ncbi:MAG: hypothetical protein M1504_02365 [Candidatus Marsarchaeota archaeon]|nr:hypothetical protein [Candidatus Marsarchaeota archaeon]